MSWEGANFKVIIRVSLRCCQPTGSQVSWGGGSSRSHGQHKVEESSWKQIAPLPKGRPTAGLAPWTEMSQTVYTLDQCSPLTYMPAISPHWYLLGNVQCCCNSIHGKVHGGSKHTYHSVFSICWLKDSASYSEDKIPLKGLQEKWIVIAEERGFVGFSAW